MAERPLKAMMSFEEAFERLCNIEPLDDVEIVAMPDAGGRVLANELAAHLNQPPHAVSSMDGYAVRSEDFQPTTSKLLVTGEVAAGDKPDTLSVGPMQAVRIFTGAPVPPGADCIVIQENVKKLEGGYISATGDIVAGRYIRPAAYDFSVNDRLLERGRTLRSSDLSLAAAAGHSEIAVRRKPSLAIVSTGNELVPPGTKPENGQIIASNALGVADLAGKFGANSFDLGIARDDIAQLKSKFKKALELKADVIVTLGGASVGDHDLVRPALEQLGAQLDFWKVAVRPGKPLMFGKLERSLVLGLPGNPVSSLVCSHIFLQPLVQRLLGLNAALAMQSAVLSSPLPANGARRHFMRAQLIDSNEMVPFIRPLPDQDSSLLSRLSMADALINVPPHQDALPEGSVCKFLTLE
ncbi:MAG: gephyrin-like molybdotransferase Glp [Pseudomonadota bacterium]